MKGIIYTRVSSDEQVKGTSLEFQEELCRKYCEQKGIEVLAVFREEGASAKTADRAEFLRAIEFCRKNKGKVDAFVVAKVIDLLATPKTTFMLERYCLITALPYIRLQSPLAIILRKSLLKLFWQEVQNLTMPSVNSAALTV